MREGTAGGEHGSLEFSVRDRIPVFRLDIFLNAALIAIQVSLANVPLAPNLTSLAYQSHSPRVLAATRSAALCDASSPSTPRQQDPPQSFALVVTSFSTLSLFTISGTKSAVEAAPTRAMFVASSALRI